MKVLRGKVAVITGGAGGIGAAMAERFLVEGMRVVVSDIREEALERTVSALRQRGGEVLGVATDVSRQQAVEELRDRTLERFGAVHVVCNNAGVAAGARGRLWEHEINDWKFAMSVHVHGVINGIHAFVPAMLEAGCEGHIVNTASHNGGFAPVAGAPVYAACKSAITTISECLWAQLREIDSAIGVSVLFPSGRTPGILNTGIWAATERPAEYASSAPIDTTNKLSMWIDMQSAAGTPVSFTPLAEVADTVVDGLLSDRFWMVEEGRFEEAVRQRADIILRRGYPRYQPS